MDYYYVMDVKYTRVFDTNRPICDSPSNKSNLLDRLQRHLQLQRFTEMFPLKNFDRYLNAMHNKTHCCADINEVLLNEIATILLLL